MQCTRMFDGKIMAYFVTNPCREKSLELSRSRFEALFFRFNFEILFLI